MFFCLQLIVGIREQNTVRLHSNTHASCSWQRLLHRACRAQLALSWMLMALTMVCGLATEAWSRPDKREADGYRGWVGDPPRTERIMMLERKKRACRDRNLLLRPELPRVYPYEQTLRTLPWHKRDEYENQPVPPAPSPLTYTERRELRDYARAYTLNYAYRYAQGPSSWIVRLLTVPLCAQDAPAHGGMVSVCRLLGRLLPVFHFQPRGRQTGEREPLRSHPRFRPVGRGRHRALVHQLHVCEPLRLKPPLRPWPSAQLCAGQVQWRYQWVSPDYCALKSNKHP